ncbi:MAG: rhodanese-like domain-containing protein [Deinococcota bacterium]
MLTKQASVLKQRWVLGTLIVLIGLVVAGIIGVFTNDVAINVATASSFTNVSVTDLANATGDYVVVDVREQWEYDQGHVPGVVLIPLGQLEARASELPDDKPIYVICRSGNRSLAASEILLQAGKQEIYNVAGGTLAWQQAGLPLAR